MCSLKFYRLSNRDRHRFGQNQTGQAQRRIVRCRE